MILYGSDKNETVEDAVSILKSFYREFRIGDKIEVLFDDTFTMSVIRCTIIDILVENKYQFACLVLPDNMRVSDYVNPMLEVDNTGIPKSLALFVEYEQGKFRVLTESKQMRIRGTSYYGNVTLPKLFKIPRQTISKIEILFKKILSSSITNLRCKLNEH